MSLVPDDGKYAVAEIFGSKLRETSAVSGFNRPQQPLVLYEFEGEGGEEVPALAAPAAVASSLICAAPALAHPAAAHPLPLPLPLALPPGCPFCRKVREAVALLDLDVLFLPTPKDGPTWRPEAIEKGGKRQVRCGPPARRPRARRTHARVPWAPQRVGLPRPALA